MRKDIYFYFKKSFFLLVSFLGFSCAQPDCWIGLSLFFASIGLSLIWVNLSNFSKKTQKFISLLGFTAVALFQIRWMVQTDYHGTYIFFVWLLLGCVIGAQYSFLSLFALHNHSLSISKKTMLVSGLWIALEMSREHIFSGFPFFSLSVALINHSPLIYLASIIGIYGLSGFLIAGNFLFFKACSLRSSQCFLVFFCFISFIFIPCFFQENFFNSSKIKKNLAVVLMQTGWAPEDKIIISGAKEPLTLFQQWEQIFKLMAKIKNESVDIIVFPEAAFSHGYSGLVESFSNIKKLFKNNLNYDLKKNIDDDAYVDNSFILQNLSLCLNVSILVGLDYHDSKTDKVYNGAFFFAPDGTHSYGYYKQKLVPMGEYLPFNWLQLMAKKYGLHTFYSEGKESRQFNFNHLRILPSICFEECFSYFMKKQVNLDTDVIINLTNDAWFTPSSFPNQHLYLAQFRAVENGRWILRSCNTGVTCIIDPFGKIVDRLPLIDEQRNLYQGILKAKLQIDQNKTYFQTGGAFFVKFFAFICCIETLRFYCLNRLIRLKEKPLGFF